MRLAGPALALGLCLPAPAAAQTAGELRVCNTADLEVRLAYVASWYIFLDDVFESHGWRAIAPGDCTTFYKGRVNTIYRLSVNFMTDSGREVADYGVSDIPQRHTRSGRWPMESFFCVSDEIFTRRGNDLSDFTRCRDGEYLQLFNVHVYVRFTEYYTVTLD